MIGKVCIVTGANSGVGLETARGLAALGATVVLVCRNKERGEKALSDIRRSTKNDEVYLLLADLGDQESIRSLADDFLTQFQQLDVLVNNAGVFLPRRTLTRDGLEATFAINHLGYFLLTHLLLEVLQNTPGARIINVSSNAHQSGTIDYADVQLDKGYSGYKSYSQSKLANVLFTSELARRLNGAHPTVNCLHPGVVATNIANHGPSAFGFFFRLFSPFFLSPAKGAKTSLYLATSPNVEGVTGKYFDNCKEKTPSRMASDVEAARRLYELSLTLTGLEGTADTRVS